MSFLGVCFLLLLILVVLVAIAFHGRIRDVENSVAALFRERQNVKMAAGAGVQAKKPPSGSGVVV